MTPGPAFFAAVALTNHWPHHCAPAYAQCGGDRWDGRDCCKGNFCEEKDAFYAQCLPEAEKPIIGPTAGGGSGGSGVVTSVDHAAAKWSSLLKESVADLEAAVRWSLAVSVGVLDVSHAQQSTVQIVRNPGGGTSKCCKQHPIAAAARAKGAAVQVQLEPRTMQQQAEWSSRNGARICEAYPHPQPCAHCACSQELEWLYTYSSFTPLTVHQSLSCVCVCTDLADVVGESLATRIHDVEYVGWTLLGKTLAFTIDLSAAACGCNAAVYLVSLRQNRQPGNCGHDRYCDANAVCGVRCAEIDLIEANRYAIHMTAHTPNDGDGKGTGLGGSFSTISPNMYGPGATMIDTEQPIRVSTYFGIDDTGSLSSIEVTIQGHTGRQLELKMADTAYVRQLHQAVKAGMTPTVSYWSDAHLGWLQDGVCPGWNEIGEGINTQMDACGDHITVSHFQVYDGREMAFPAPPPSHRPPPMPPPVAKPIEGSPPSPLPSPSTPPPPKTRLPPPSQPPPPRTPPPSPPEANTSLDAIGIGGIFCFVMLGSYAGYLFAKGEVKDGAARHQIKAKLAAKSIRSLNRGLRKVAGDEEAAERAEAKAKPTTALGIEEEEEEEKQKEKAKAEKSRRTAKGSNPERASDTRGGKGRRGQGCKQITKTGTLVLD